MKGQLTAWIVFALCLWPTVAGACPVCFDPREESRLAFLVTTIFMTVLPLLLIGCAVLWFLRRAKHMNRSDDVVGGGQAGGSVSGSSVEAVQL